MWFLDTNHPSFFVRMLARVVRLILGVILLVVVLLAALWAYDTFGHHDLYNQVLGTGGWLRDGRWKQTLGAVIGFLVIAPVVMDMLFGDSNNYNNGGYNNRNNGNYNGSNRNNGGYNGNNQRFDDRNGRNRR